MLSEFALIQRYFQSAATNSSVLLGIGDDAALLQPPAGEVLAITTDTLVAGRHFPVQTSAHAIGHKALAVNLSDLAAMGAKPRWFTLALTLPEVSETWLSEFSAGLLQLAQQAGICLVGGDTTRGALSITITAIGSVPQGLALLRSGAQVGDGIYVSGTVGDAGLGLAVALAQAPSIATEYAAYAQQRLDYPQPRLALGLALRQRASACLDISDGLAQDLGHILHASGVGADIHLDQLPLSPALRTLSAQQAWHYALTAGDDYELCFTLADNNAADLTSVTRIGTIRAQQGLTLYHQGQPYDMPVAGYQHF